MKTNSGFVLLSTLFCTIIMSALSVIMFQRAVSEMKAIEFDIDRMRAYCSAEAGLQGAIAGLKANAYTGFISSANFDERELFLDQSKVGTCSATVTMIDGDTASIQAVGRGINLSRALDAQVQLESIFSKYFVFSENPNFSSGSGAQYGSALRDPNTGQIMYDSNGRPRCVEDDYMRAWLYFRGDWNISGTDIKLFGNAYVENNLNVDAKQNSLDVVGDTFVGGNYIETGALTVDDTYDDGVDKNVMTNMEREAEFPTLQDSFYSSNSSIPVAGVGDRTFEFSPSLDGSYTVVKEYSSRNYNTLINTYNLPTNAIIYVNGDAYVKGSISGRVTVFATDDIHIQGSLQYNNGLDQADSDHSAAYLANDIIYFNHPDMVIDGIFYAGHTSTNAHAQDASRTLDGELDLGGKNCIVVNGNRIMKGNSFMSHYAHRLYLHDDQLRKYPPPGLPVTTMVRTVREIAIPSS
jgi:hypothetical protein